MTKEEIANKLNEVWQRCGDDLFMNDYGKIDHKKTYSRDALFEICVDLLGGYHYEAQKELIAMSLHERNEVKLLAFPDYLYGY
jgi:hypothetical protein